MSDVFKIFSSDVTSNAWVDAFLANIKAELLREIDARGGETAIWANKWFPPQVIACCLPLLERQTEEEFHEAAEWFAAADNPQEDPIVSAAMDYVRAHYQEKLKLQDIAKQLHVNSAYLGQRIKNTVAAPLTNISMNTAFKKPRSCCAGRICAFRMSRGVWAIPTRISSPPSSKR